MFINVQHIPVYDNPSDDVHSRDEWSAYSHFKFESSNPEASQKPDATRFLGIPYDVILRGKNVIVFLSDCPLEIPVTSFPMRAGFILSTRRAIIKTASVRLVPGLR